MIKSRKEILREEFDTPEKIQEYLAEAKKVFEEEKDIGFYLVALREVVDATIGMSKLARESGLSRSNLYNQLAIDGSPGYELVLRVEEVVGDVCYSMAQYIENINCSISVDTRSFNKPNIDSIDISGFECGMAA